MAETCVWLLLGIGSVCDLFRKKVPVLLLGFGGMAGVFWGTWQGLGAARLVTDLLPGLALLSLAFVSRRRIGYGDGFLAAALGLLEGGAVCFAAICAALFLVSLYGMAMLACRKATAGTQIPFVPFLAAAHAALTILKIG